MMTAEPHVWQQLCTIERRASVPWVLEEVQAMLPAGTQLWTEVDEEYTEVWCAPALDPQAQTAFEAQFDARNFTDIAFLTAGM